MGITIWLVAKKHSEPESVNTAHKHIELVVVSIICLNMRHIVCFFLRRESGGRSRQMRKSREEKWLNEETHWGNDESIYTAATYSPYTYNIQHHTYNKLCVIRNHELLAAGESTLIRLVFLAAALCLLLRHTCTLSPVTSIYSDLQLTLSSRLQCHKSAAA